MTIPTELYVYIVSEEDYADGTVIMGEGGHGNWAYIVLEGRVKQKKRTARGLVTISTLKKGGIFGESNLLRNTREKRIVSIVAEGPVVLGLLDSDKITRDMDGLSPQLRKLIVTLAKRQQDVNIRFIDMLVKQMGNECA